MNLQILRVEDNGDVAEQIFTRSIGPGQTVPILGDDWWHQPEDPGLPEECLQVVGRQFRDRGRTIRILVRRQIP